MPFVTGHVDRGILDRLAAVLLRTHNIPAPGEGQPVPPAFTSSQPGDLDAWLQAPGWLAEAAGRAARKRAPQPAGPGTGTDTGTDTDPDTKSEAEAVRVRLARNAVHQLIIKAAADLMSGPAGLASYLRTGLAGELAASVSLPLDAGATVEIVPAYLRRLLAKRDRGCRFPGCDQPAMACHPHHIVPRSEGGPTSLTNMLLLCSFHHLIAVHRWGWGIVLMPDGSVTATSPDKTRVLHSHGPPGQAA